MKKPLIIGIGIGVFVLIFLVWVYLFLFGAPTSSGDFFTDLGFETDNQPTSPIATESDSDEDNFSLVDTYNSALRQLTTRPVAGFVATEIASSTKVRYVEQGTSHIYEIDLMSGEERRVSGTTIPRVNEAVFSSNGEEVVVKSADGYERKVFVGRIVEGDDGSLTGYNLPPESRDWQFVDEGLKYTLADNTGTEGYLYDPSTNSQQTIFSVPFLSVTTLFEEGRNIIYNRHTPNLPGGLYESSGFSLTPITSTRFGLSALVNDDWTIVSHVSDSDMDTLAILNESGKEYQVALDMIPEKCTFNNENPNTIWCAAPIGDLSNTYQDDWYKGLVRSNDVFWLVNILTGSADLVLNPSLTIGRELDVINLTQFGDVLFFVNKNDNTLWLYDYTNF